MEVQQLTEQLTALLQQARSTTSTMAHLEIFKQFFTTIAEAFIDSYLKLQLSSGFEFPPLLDGMSEDDDSIIMAMQADMEAEHYLICDHGNVYFLEVEHDDENSTDTTMLSVEKKFWNAQNYIVELLQEVLNELKATTTTIQPSL